MYAFHKELISGQSLTVKIKSKIYILLLINILSNGNMR